uniref:Signal peptidase complex subunit 2 n=1 Tax=Arabidopsis thaliana TaxID=3702 RepID=O04199_ARATH|nr:unknown protein [Arabidopsis thaliana]
MEEKKTESTNKNVKKANLLDHHSIKHILDESVSDIVTSRGYKEDVRLSNLKLILGTIIIVVALVAQFYNKKFPENRDFLIGCIALYPFFSNSIDTFCFLLDSHLVGFQDHSPALVWWYLQSCPDSLISTLSPSTVLIQNQSQLGSQFSSPKVSPNGSRKMEFLLRVYSGKT